MHVYVQSSIVLSSHGQDMLWHAWHIDVVHFGMWSMSCHVLSWTRYVMACMFCHDLTWTRQDMARHVHLFVIVVMASMSRHILSWTRQDMLSTTTITNKHTCLAMSCPGQVMSRHACHNNNNKQTCMSCPGQDKARHAYHNNMTCPWQVPNKDRNCLRCI